MMDWEKILWALALGAMILLLWPQAKRMLAESRKAEPGEWAGVILPLLGVVALVFLLVMLVR